MNYQGLYISFSLYGNKPLYNVGLIENLKLIPRVYPGARAVVYLSGDVSSMTRLQIRNFSGVTVVQSNEIEYDVPPMMRRFCVPDIIAPGTRFIVRDCDSRLSVRERKAIDEWVASELMVHVMKDHPHHTSPIMGGMWGARSEFFQSKGSTSCRIAMTASSPEHFIYGDDQIWLAGNVYYPAKEEGQVLEHNSFAPGGRPFPSRRDGLEFAGERYDILNRPFVEDREVLRKAIQ